MANVLSNDSEASSELGARKQADPQDKRRRTFLTDVGLVAAGVAAAIVTVPAIAFLLGLRKTQPFGVRLATSTISKSVRR